MVIHFIIIGKTWTIISIFVSPRIPPIIICFKVSIVFLLSYQDYTNPDYGFSSDSTAKDLKRKCLQSDYAASKDLYDGNSDAGYWTRSPYYYNPRYNSNCEVGWYVNAITPMEDYQQNKYSIEGYSYVFDSRYLDEPGGVGVRPAITIEL